MKLFGLLVIVFFTLSYSSFAKDNTKFSKKDIILTGITVLNPALSVGTLLSNANTMQKIFSFGNLAYATKEGKTITESAYTQSIKKKCLIKNLFSKKEFCL